MVIEALQNKLLIASFLCDPVMWTEANKAIYVILTAENVA